MQIKNYLLVAILLCLSELVCAQNAKLIGKVSDELGQAFPGVTIKIGNSKLGTLSNANGEYQLDNIPAGKQIVRLYVIGYKPFEQELVFENGEVQTLNVKLTVDAKQLNTVNVVAKSNLQNVKDQPFQVTAIDAKALHNTSQDINQVLGKTAGVRIREDGGMGSSFNFSLNGFSGRQVRFFLDGVPMDNFGSALSLNNIPINLAERIEVYKGVVPIWLGADALGGAINIVSNGKSRDYIDVSYSYGSFNTHRAALSGAYTHQKTGWTVNANIFKNYSDNNYWVTTGVTNLNSKVISQPQKLRRFHDRYSSESVQIETGFVAKKFADKLLFGVILAQNDKQIQTGAQMSKVYGGWHQNSNTFMPSLKYQKKDLWLKGLNISLFGSVNYGKTQNVDTLNRFYNWAGEYTDNSFDSTGKYIPGAENSRSLYLFRNNSATVTASLSYKLSAQHSFGANYVFSNFDRIGSDVLRPNDIAYTQPQVLRKHNLGLGYYFDYNSRLQVSLFAKQFLAEGRAGERVDIYTNPRWVQTTNQLNSTGYGMAAAYFLFKNLQLKSSFEKTYRLPDGEELFGDGINHTANKNLKPENSNNLNLGFVYSPIGNETQQLVVEANFSYRKAADFIRVDVVDTRTQSTNVRGVMNTGFDAAISYAYNKWTTTANLTYQYLYNTTEFEPGSNLPSPVYLDQIPNIPFLFGNASLSYRLNQADAAWGQLSINYNLNYVAAYYLKWPSLGNKLDKSEIPMQLSHDLAINFSVKEGRYNLSLDCRNITNAALYDNFLMQKPGRAFYLKCRYFLHK